MKLFYSHLILIHEVHHQLESLPIKDSKKEELINLIEETVHHKILHSILDHLPTKHHENFLVHYHSSPYDLEILTFLKRHDPEIEDKIKQAAEEVKYDLIKTIRES